MVVITNTLDKANDRQKKKSSKRYELDNTNKSENCNSQSQQHALVQAQTRSHQSSCGTGNLELTKKMKATQRTTKKKKKKFPAN